MPSTDFINTNSLDPSQSAIQNQIALQQQAQLAAALQEQAFQPVTSVGGQNAPLSPLQGLAKMLQGYQAGQARHKVADLQTQQLLMQNDQMDRLFGTGKYAAGAPPPTAGDAATATPAATAPSAVAAQAAPAPSLAPPPSDPNAQSVEPLVARQPGQTLSAALAQPPAGAPQVAQTPSGLAGVPAAPAARGSMLPSLTGNPQQDRLMASQMGLPKYLELAAGQYAPTDQAKNDARVGISPAQRKGMDLRESLKQLMLPNAPGIVNADQNGNPTYQELPGLQAGIAGQAGAITAQQEANKPIVTPNAFQPGGAPRIDFVVPPAVQQQQAQAAGAGPGGGGQAVPNATGAPQVIPPTSRQFSAADLEGMKSGAQEGIKYSAKLSDDANSALQGKQTLGEMTNLLQGFNPGKFAPVLGALGAVAQSAGVSPDLVQSLTNVDPGNAEAFQKGTARLATEAAKQVSSRVTQMEFKTFLANNPNWMMQPDGIKRVMDYMGKGFDQTLDKQKAFAQYSKSASPDRWPIDFESQWNQTQRERIASGATNSLPPALTGIRTRSDVQAGAQQGPSQFTEGQTATDPKTGARYQFSGGKWNQLAAQPGRPGQQ